MSGPTDAVGFFPLVYDELRRLAAAKLRDERPGHTLDATALVHEAFVRLGGARFEDRAGFFRAAAVAIQRILVDHARAKRAVKRGGAGRRLALDDGHKVVILDADTLLDLDAAVKRLAEEDPRAADLARLRLFAGLATEEAGAALGLSRTSAFREWTYARAWLTAALAAGNDDGSGD